MCTCMYVRVHRMYTRGYYIHVKRGRQTLRLNGFPAEALGPDKISNAGIFSSIIYRHLEAVSNI